MPDQINMLLARVAKLEQDMKKVQAELSALKAASPHGRIHPSAVALAVAPVTMSRKSE